MWLSLDIAELEWFQKAIKICIIKYKYKYPLKVVA